MVTKRAIKLAFPSMNRSKITFHVITYYPLLICQQKKILPGPSHYILDVSTQ